MNRVKIDSLILLLCLKLFVFSTVRCATFKNITVTLRKDAFHYEDKKQVFIPSADSLSEYFAEEPYELIHIQDQKIPILEKNSVANLSKTKFININRCRVSDIQPGAFKNLPKVLTLDLSENNIEVIKDGVFTDLEIDGIDLSHNKLSQWNGEWVRGSTIRSITLSYNFIEEIPENSLAYLKPRYGGNKLKVWQFYVNDNKVRKIHPKAFNGVRQLDLLYVSQNFLKEIPVEMFENIEYLSYVDFTNNLFSCFPLEIANVTKIKNKVNLARNPLKCDCVNNWLKNIKQARRIFKHEDLDIYKKRCLTD